METVVKIKTIRITSLRNDAHFQFHSDVSRLITEENPDKLGIAPLFATYQPLITREDEALKKIVKSELTKKIKEADKERDKAYSSVSAIIRTTLKHHNPEVVDAAERLKIVIDTYGHINQKSYDEQTSAVYNILQEFKGKYADDIALIRIPELVDELERANVAFDTLIKKRTDEAAQQNPDTMKDVRVEVDAAYHAIEERINAAVVMEGPDKYASFVTRMNATIDRYKNLLARSQHEKHDDPEEDEAGE